MFPARNERDKWLIVPQFAQAVTAWWQDRDQKPKTGPL